MHFAWTFENFCTYIQLLFYRCICVFMYYTYLLLCMAHHYRFWKIQFAVKGWTIIVTGPAKTGNLGTWFLPAFSFSELVTFYPNMLWQWNFQRLVQIYLALWCSLQNKMFYSSTEIWLVERQGVVCAHMPCFRRPSHIY